MAEHHQPHQRTPPHGGGADGHTRGTGHDHDHGAGHAPHGRGHEQHHRARDEHHAHHHGGPAHGAAATGGARALLTALLLTGSYALVEIAGGWYAGSLALISDAGHMAADAGALLIALLAARLAARPSSGRNSFGYGRAEVIGAFINGLTMLAVVVWIAVEAVARFFKPLPIAGGVVMLVAALGLAVNLVVLWLLTRAGGHAGHAHGNLNTRAAAIHVLGDLFGSVAAVAAGAVVQFTGWTPIDPILSVLVACLILRSTWSLLVESVDVLMESVPAGVDYAEVGKLLASIEGVASVHDLHIWQMSAGRRALSAHLLLRDVAAWPRVLARARAVLKTVYGIDHVTLQPEWLPAVRADLRVIPLKVENAASPARRAP
jgi:cobalt-zinc-cadmium efflux system protein